MLVIPVKVIKYGVRVHHFLSVVLSSHFDAEITKMWYKTKSKAILTADQ